jgi:hypothetical protein
MRTPRDLALHFARWYCHEGENDLLPYLAEAFTYNSGLGIFDRDEFLGHWRRGPMANMNVLCVVPAADGFAVLIEATDTVTQLRHRMAFFGVVVGEKVTCAWRSNEIVHPMDLEAAKTSPSS